MTTHPARHRVPGRTQVSTPGRRLAAILGDAASVLVVVAALVVLVPGFFGIHRYAITGGSMSGSFGPGAIVFAQDVPVEELAVGDVITYQPPADSGLDALVTHRISRIEHDPDQKLLFRTKGDANADEDPWQFTIDGAHQPRMVLAVDHLGWPLIWLADPLLRVALIGAPACAIFLLAGRELIWALRQPQEPRAQLIKNGHQ